jgi:hypothetical protein
MNFYPLCWEEGDNAGHPRGNTKISFGSSKRETDASHPRGNTKISSGSGRRETKAGHPGGEYGDFLLSWSVGLFL